MLQHSVNMPQAAGGLAVAARTVEGYHNKMREIVACD